MSEIEISWAEDEALLADAEVERAVFAALERGGRPRAPLAVTFVGEEHLTALHAHHLDDPTATDVITFALGDEGEGPVGELYVSVDRAREMAHARGVTLARELTLYVVHGVLHLCGYDDHDDEDRGDMRAAEADVLAQLGHPPDPTPHDA